MSKILGPNIYQKRPKGDLLKIWGLIIGLSIFLAFFYPMPFIADDWEHLYSFYMGDRPKILFWIYRNPFHAIWHLIYFPLFLIQNGFWAKWSLFLMLLLSAYLLLEVFIEGFREKLGKNWGYFFLIIFIAFPLNNYEWSFWPTMLTSTPSLYLLCLGFHLYFFRPSKLNLIIKMFFYLIAATTFECLLVLAWNLELTKYLFLSGKNKNTLFGILSFLKEVLPITLVFIVFKIISQIFFPYGYAAEFGFKGWLFGQFFSLIFSVDYYKQLWALGIPWGILFFILTYEGIKNFSRVEIQKAILLFIFFVSSASYYYLVMNYSSRRALAGPMIFSQVMGAIALSRYLATNLRIGQKINYKGGILFLGVVSIYFFHQINIFNYKSKENLAINQMTKDIKVKVNALNLGEKVVVGLDLPKSYIKQRSWNFIEANQMRGYLLHNFTKDELEKIEFK